MKRIWIGLLTLFILISCTNSTSITQDRETAKSQVAINDSTGKIALNYLFSKISDLPKVSFKDDEILIGDSSIRLKINVEFDGQKENKWIYAANIATLYKTNTEIQINVGSIGIGSNKEEAINVCIHEWFSVFGIPFINMLNKSNSINVANIKVFSGIMGIRGNLPKNTWLKGDGDMTRKIISQIQSLIKNKSGDIIPIDIKLMIGKNGVTNGECRIDNEVSTILLNKLKQLNWPSPEEEFMFKQFYLVENFNQ